MNWNSRPETNFRRRVAERPRKRAPTSTGPPAFGAPGLRPLAFAPDHQANAVRPIIAHLCALFVVCLPLRKSDVCRMSEDSADFESWLFPRRKQGNCESLIDVSLIVRCINRWNSVLFDWNSILFFFFENLF